MTTDRVEEITNAIVGEYCHRCLRTESPNFKGFMEDHYHASYICGDCWRKYETHNGLRLYGQYMKRREGGD